MSTDSLQPTGDDATEPADTSSTVEGDIDVPESFTATITVGYVQRFLDAIRALDDECRLRIAPGGMSASVVGEANVTMAEATGRERFRGLPHRQWRCDRRPGASAARNRPHEQQQRADAGRPRRYRDAPGPGGSARLFAPVARSRDDAVDERPRIRRVPIGGGSGRR